MNSRARQAAIAAVFLLAVALVVGVVLANGRGDSGSTNAASTSSVMPASSQTVVDVIGDSYTGGSDQGGRDEKGWPRLVNAQLGDDWNIVDNAEGGSGYSERGPGGLNFLDVSQSAFDNRPNLIVFFGSRNDAGQNFAPNATKAYQLARQQAPNAKLLIVGPAWTNSRVPPSVLTVRDTLRTLAQQNYAAFYDPIAEGWFFDRPDLIGSDGVHPTDAGHAYMAAKLVPVLRAQLPGASQ